MKRQGRRIAEGGVWLRPLPKNLRPQDAALFAAEAMVTSADAYARPIENVAFTARGEFFDGETICPEYYPENDHAPQRSVEELAARARRAREGAYRIAGETLWITDRHSANYYHWICDCLPRLEAWLETVHSARLLLPHRAFDQRFVRESLEAYREVEIVAPPATGQGGVAEHLWVAGPVAANGSHHERLSGMVADRLRSHFGADTAAAKHRLWITRSLAGRRRIANESEIAPILARHGYRVVAMETMQLGEQVRLAAAARSIAGAHGAGLANLTFMPAGGCLVELRQMAGVPNFFFTLAAARRQDYYYLACEPALAGQPVHAADIVCDAAALDRLLGEIGERHPS